MERVEAPAPGAPPDEEDYDYTPAAEPADTQPQVSSMIAIIRIVSVLIMGLCVSFGLFMMLVGLKGLIVGVPLVLAAIPCYYGMQFAEKLAVGEERKRTAERQAAPTDIAG